MATKTSQNSAKGSKNIDKISFYDDDKHSYEEFWEGRDYEHHAELLAISKLLTNKHYKVAMDFGGGYGRVSPAISEFTDKLILVDPSKKQLDIAKKFLKDYSNVEYLRVDKKDSVPAKDKSLDLLVMIRVSHHLEEPAPIFAEIFRALKPGGEAIIEIANEAHFKNRVKYWTQLKGVPLESTPIGVFANGKKENTPFFNHNPKLIAELLVKTGFVIENKLSVSNLRSGYIKRKISMDTMLKVEKGVQSKLSFMDFGPSIFFLVKRP